MNVCMIYSQSIASNVANKKTFLLLYNIIYPLLAQCIQSSPWVILSFAEFYFYQIKFRIGIPKFDVLIVANHSHYVRVNGHYGTGGWADRLVVIYWYTNSPTLVRKLYNIWRGSRFRCIWDSVMFFNCPWFHQIQYVISKKHTRFQWMNGVIKMHVLELNLCATGPWLVRDSVSPHCLVCMYTWQVHNTGGTLIWRVYAHCAESRII